MQLSPLMLLVSFFLPAIIGLITRLIKDSDGRFWASFLVCVVVGSLIDLLQHNGSYNGLQLIDAVNSLASSALVLTGLVKLSYRAVWDNKEVGKFLPNEIAKKDESPLQGMGLKPDK